ncbi:MAG: sulfatase [Opitutaceae bacterium]
MKITPSLILLFMAVSAGLAAAASPPAKPNIIVIFTDDQGYNDLGCFGSQKIKTPHLDQMAREGLMLTHFYAQPVCGVSRASLMTGSYPIRVGEPDNMKRLHTVLHPEEITMAEMLKDAGYATALIGKWHLAGNPRKPNNDFDPALMPNAQGFDYFYGTPRFNGFTVYVEDTPVRSRLLRNEEVIVEAVQSWDHITQDYTREALQWIDQNQSEPFFLYLAHNLPHVPVGASENFKGKSDYGPYGDTIEEIDWSSGEIFAKLKELGLDENTLVIFTSDNGPWIEPTHAPMGSKRDGEPFIPLDHSGSALPLKGWKMSAWEGGSRVPFIARWPGQIPAGRQSAELLSTMDLLPTFAHLSGAKLPTWEIDGHDASAFLRGETATSPREDYFYYAGCMLTGVRAGKWKLVLPREGNPAGTGWWGRLIEQIPETLLFDLDQDPAEASNLANVHSDIVQSLLQRIDAAREELGDLENTGNGVRFFDEGPRRLQVPLPSPKS